MNKSGTLITSALLTWGIAAGATAADMPKTAAPISVDATATATTVADAPKKAKKHSKKSKKAAPTT
jgi:hypothetical protein